jgi:beta-phosphoglucomutase-like phosphatase (HAD superfamily)
MIEIPPGVRGLVFDCDGTLVDSMPIHKRLWDEGLAPYGVVLPRDYIDTHAGKPTEVIVELVNRDWGVSIDPAEFHHEKERRYLLEVDAVGPIAPVVATARRWLGTLPMAVVSGGVMQNVERSLRAIDAWEWFPVVLTADDPIAPKPAPDLFLAAAELLGVAAHQCHAFEDADAGIAAARAAGMSVTDVRELA